jgi:putative transposase
MATTSSMDLVALVREHLAEAHPDVLRSLLETFVEALMGAEVDAICGADYRHPSPERTNRRNGYRQRPWDTRVGTIELGIPKLRQGTYFPDWLLERRRRSEVALTSVIATCYVLGVSTRRLEKLAEALGITKLSKSQISEMAHSLDAEVKAFRTRPLDSGPYPIVWADALVVKVREAGRTVNVHVLVVTGVNAEGHREILGVEVATSEDKAGWLACWRSLVARGLSGVVLVISDAHQGLVDAIGETLPGVTWQRLSYPLSAGSARQGGQVPAALAWQPWCAPSSTSRTPPRWRLSSNGSPRRWLGSCLRLLTTSSKPVRTCWPSGTSRRSSGARSGVPTRRSA